MPKTKYILVSQGIKIYETYDKDEADRMADESNREWYKYLEECAERGEPCADNEVFVCEEFECDCEHYEIHGVRPNDVSTVSFVCRKKTKAYQSRRLY